MGPRPRARPLINADLTVYRESTVVTPEPQGGKPNVGPPRRVHSMPWLARDAFGLNGWKPSKG
jgi:hypothetical protein